MDLNLSGKTAVVCGSTQGLGWASACELAMLGAKIVLLARNEQKLKEKTTELKLINNAGHSYLIADFAEPSSVQETINVWVAQGNKADILVNNTGGPASGPILTAKTDEFVTAFNSHLVCNHILATALIPGMKEIGSGRIVNIISTSVKAPLPNLGVSNTVRAAVGNWSKTLANELAQFNITVNNVLPGLNATSRAEYIIEKKMEDQSKEREEVLQEMVSEIPMRRMGLPGEVGAAVAFLCTPAAAYITGINVPVDGGRTASL